MMSRMEHQGPISTTAAAEIFGVTPKTVARWADAGEIPANRLPGPYGRWIFDATELRNSDKFMSRKHAAEERAENAK